MAITPALTSDLNLIQGTPGDDDLIGTERNDFVILFDGVDVFDGQNDDPALGDGNDVIQAGAGDDEIITGDGNNQVFGDAGDDTITASFGNDLIYGGDGNDTVNGGDGNDIIYGEAGTETLATSLGNDTLNGGNGDDLVLGEVGDDILTGGFGSDFLSGGLGDDIINSHDSKVTSKVIERDEMFGGVGADEFNLFANYLGGRASSRPAKEGKFTDSSFAVIRDFSITEGDTLNLLDPASRYQFVRGNFGGRSASDVFITTRTGNTVAIVLDTSVAALTGTAAGGVVGQVGVTPPPVV